MQQGGGQLGAGATQGVSQGDGTAIDINQLQIQIEFLDDGQGLGGEGFVEFDQIDVALFQPGHLQGCRNRLDRTDTHDLRGDSSDREADKARQGFGVDRFKKLFRYNQDRRRTIGHLRARAGGDRAVQFERRGQPGEPCEAGVSTHAIINADQLAIFLQLIVENQRLFHLHRNYFVAEAAGGNRCCRFLVTANCKDILLLAADSVFIGNQFGGDAHGGVTFRPAGD